MSTRDTGKGAELAYVAAATYDGLGEFWRRVFQDRELIRQLESGTSNLSAQLYQQFNETALTSDRLEMPVYARQRWRLVTIVDADANKAPGRALRVGGKHPPTVGAQTAPPYVAGFIPVVGGYVPLSGNVSYPLPSGIVGMTAIVDRVGDPRNILIPGADFTLDDGTITFKHAADPFKLGFPSRVVMRDGVEVREVSLWCRDVASDDNFTARFFSYALGVAGTTSDWYKRYINALWTLAQSGGTDAAFQACVYAALDLPTASHSIETVEHVGALDAGGFGVVTSEAVYRLARGSDAAVAVGDVISRGTPITTAARINDARDAERVGALPLAGLSVSAPYAASDITYVGNDANGNPRLRFSLCGDADAVDAFWRRVDTFAENNNTNQANLLQVYLFESRPAVPGAVWGSLSPARFFVDYYYGNSAKFITVDRGRLSEFGLQGLDRLREALKYLPATTRLVIQTDVGVADEVEGLVESGQPAGFALCGVADAVPRPADCVTAYLVPTCKGGRI